MTSRVLKKILRDKHIGYAIFDADGTLVEQNFKACAYFAEVELRTRESNLWALFPELVGSEDVVRALLARERRGFVLENVNKIEPGGDVRYYRLYFSRLRDARERQACLLCLIEEVTESALLQQRARQSEYELQLLRAQAASRQQFLAGSILGKSQQVEQVRQFIRKIAMHNTTVLLQGESGTGKSLVARVIHRASANPQGPFVEINCAAIPATLLESELFGYEKGAFTNAFTSKKGLLEEAHGGTLFLDEIGEMPLSLQAKLLSFLETRTYRRLGSTEERMVDLRLITASNRNLKQAMAQNEFRQDLYFRINVVSMRMPPLRDLGNDIVLLANHFIHLLRYDIKKNIGGLSPAAQRKLKSYAWPGNVRELRNVIERAMIFAEGTLIDACDIILPEDSAAHVESAAALQAHIPDAGLSLEALEKQFLINALRKTGGNQSRAAALLNLSLDTFRYRLKKFNISPKSFQ